MPNWCLNKLKVTGNEQEVEAVKALILNDKGVVDFEIVCPVPLALLGLTNSYIPGLLNDFGHLPHIDFKFNDENPNRIGLATPEDFLSRAKAFCKENDTKEVFEDLEAEGYAALVAESNIIKPGVAIETSIADAVNAWRKLSNEERLPENSPITDDLTQLIMSVLSLENSAYCEKTFGYDSAYYWAISNWGTKWNVSESYQLEDLGEASIGWEFSTAWGYPSEWFHSLMMKVDEMEGNSIKIELAYAESGMWFGGCVGTDKDGFSFEDVWDDEEITEFLGEEEEDENYQVEDEP